VKQVTPLKKCSVLNRLVLSIVSQQRPNDPSVLCRQCDNRPFKATAFDQTFAPQAESVSFIAETV